MVIEGESIIEKKKFVTMPNSAPITTAVEGRTSSSQKPSISKTRVWTSNPAMPMVATRENVSATKRSFLKMTGSFAWRFWCVILSVLLAIECPENYTILS